MYFYLFRKYLPLEKAGPFIWTNLNPRHHRILCTYFGWNCPSGSVEEAFLNSVNAFSFYRNYLPLETGVSLHLNKLESASPKECVRSSLVEIGPVVLENMKMWKFTDRRRDRQTDRRADGRQAIKKAQLNFRLRWVKRHCYENRYIEWYYRQATGVLIKTKLSSNLAEVAYIWNECKIFNVTLFRIVLICFFYTKGKMFFLIIYINIEGMVGAKIKILWSTDKIQQCIYT